MFLRTTVRLLRQPGFYLLVALSAGTIFGTDGTANAMSFIDDFSVVKNGTLIFRDQFDDGVPPPSAPNFITGGAASYFVNGSMNTSGEKVRLDTVGTFVSPSVVTGQDPFFENAILSTNIDQTNLTAGLKIVDTFSVRNLFDLTVPTQNLAFYSVRLTDATAMVIPNDLVQLGVRRGSDGVDRVESSKASPGSLVIQDLALDLSHNQILLELLRANPSNGAITAAFAYVDGGVIGPFTPFGSSFDIFTGEDYTRAELCCFRAYARARHVAPLRHDGGGTTRLHHK
jgi:hypothetical protein